MNVLFLSQVVPYPPHGGVLQRGYNLLRELGQQANVHLLAFVHPDVLPTKAAIEESREALGKFCTTVEYFPLWAKASSLHFVSALATSVCSSTPFSMIAHRSRTFGQRVTELLRTAPFDVVHVDTLALCQFADSDRSSIPAVLTHHNIESMLMERRAQVDTRFLARKFLHREAAKLREAERVASPRFDLNIVMSPSDESDLASRAPGVRTVVVPNGVDTAYFTPDPDQEKPALIYGGGMNMFANRDAVMYFLAEIWPLVRAQRPDVQFFAVGQDPPRELVAFADRDTHVVVTGYVADIREFIRRAAVYVVPLRVGGGTRLKVLDAMAMGKALVSTSIGCEGLDARPNDHLIIADTPKAFADATLALLADGGRRRCLGRAARELVERRYAWPVVGHQLIDAYRGAIETRKLGG